MKFLTLFLLCAFANLAIARKPRRQLILNEIAKHPELNNEQLDIIKSFTQLVGSAKHRNQTLKLYQMIQQGKNEKFIKRKIKSRVVKRKLFVSPSVLQNPTVMTILKVVLAVVLGRVVNKKIASMRIRKLQQSYASVSTQMLNSQAKKADIKRQLNILVAELEDKIDDFRDQTVSNIDSLKGWIHHTAGRIL